MCDFAINTFAVFIAALSGVAAGAILMIAFFYLLNAILSQIEIEDRTNV